MKLTNDEMMGTFTREIVAGLPHPDKTKAVRRGNIFFAIDETTGKLYAFKQEAKKGNIRYRAFLDDEDVIKETKCDIPKKFVKVMNARGTHPALVEAATQRNSDYRSSLLDRRARALLKISMEENIPMETLNNEYTSRLSKWGITLTRTSANEALPKKINVEL